MVSDLHIGDGRRHDNFSRRNKADLFRRFLDYVQKQNAELIIAGDFLELWNCKIEEILETYGSIFEHLDNIKCTYILGNHDQQLKINNLDLSFYTLRQWRNFAFRKIGCRTFKFTHGHEVDPFIGKSSEIFCKAFGLITNTVDFSGQAVSISRDCSSEFILEIGQLFISGINSVRQLINRAADECCSLLPDDKAVMIKNSLRMRNMLKYYHHDITKGLYNIAIAAHTHQAGCFGNWYYNSGSWTGDKSNFLRIDQNGNVDILNWVKSGPEFL